jgi:transposase InsO family protein
MTNQTGKTVKDWQKTADFSADPKPARSALLLESSEKPADPHEGPANTGVQPVKPLSKNAVWSARRSAENRLFIAVSDAAKLTGLEDRRIREYAAENKYPGAFKTPVNGIDVWMIPLDALPPLAQTLYWHEKQTAAGFTKDLFLGGTSFTDPEEREEHHKQYDQATAKLQGRARRRFTILVRFENLLRQGMGKCKAYGQIRREYDVPRSTFNLWQESVDGLDQSDWLPALVPDYVRRSNALRAPWPSESWTFFLRDATTPGRDLATAYKRTEREAGAQGWGDLPSLTTARLDYRKVDAAVIALLKQGETALKALSPTVQRDYGAYALHETWSMDGRRIDLMVRDTKGEFGPNGSVFRLWIYAIEEVRSRYLVGYAIGSALNSDLVRDALTTALRKTGLIRPSIVQCDNGMESAAKEITGGAPYRLRGKVKEDEIIGLLPFLNITVSFATPAHGQAKPVERLFGTLANMSETRPEFKGAYCANTTEKRPEEWDAKKAVSIELVRELLEEEVFHYHRTPHRGDSMDGKSPLQTYTELMNAPGFVPKRISEKQFRRCVLSAINITIQKNGSFIILGARYYSDQTARLAKGRGYYAIFNRYDLAEPVTVYRSTKIVAEHVEQIERTPGNCKESAKKIMKARSDFTKATKAQAKAIFDQQQIETPTEIRRALAEKHPEIAAKMDAEKLPVAAVVEITQPRAEVPKDKPGYDPKAEAEARKRAEEADAAIWGKPAGRKLRKA